MARVTVTLTGTRASVFSNSIVSVSVRILAVSPILFGHFTISRLFRLYLSEGGWWVGKLQDKQGFWEALTIDYRSSH